MQAVQSIELWKNTYSQLVSTRMVFDLIDAINVQHKGLTTANGPLD